MRGYNDGDHGRLALAQALEQLGVLRRKKNETSVPPAEEVGLVVAAGAARRSHLATMSAVDQISRTSSTRVARLDVETVGVRRGPAPASTRSSWPALTSLATVWGEVATRRSSGRLS